MKKVYTKPTTVAISMEVEQVLATSIAISDKTVDTSETGVQLSNKKDGMWGDSEDQWGGSPWE